MPSSKLLLPCGHYIDSEIARYVDTSNQSFYTCRHPEHKTPIKYVSQPFHWREIRPAPSLIVPEASSQELSLREQLRNMVLMRRKQAKNMTEKLSRPLEGLEKP